MFYFKHQFCSTKKAINFLSEYAEIHNETQNEAQLIYWEDSNISLAASLGIDDIEFPMIFQILSTWFLDIIVIYKKNYLEKVSVNEMHLSQKTLKRKA